MAITYEPIATTTLGSAAASVTFSSISGSYTDLVLVVTGIGATVTTFPWIRFNGLSTNIYSIQPFMATELLLGQIAEQQILVGILQKMCNCQ
jgi:hypothetical protein